MAQGKPQTPASHASTPDDLAAYYFHQGTTTYAYDYLGAHYSDGTVATLTLPSPTYSQSVTSTSVVRS